MKTLSARAIIASLTITTILIFLFGSSVLWLRVNRSVKVAAAHQEAQLLGRSLNALLANELLTGNLFSASERLKFMVSSTRLNDFCVEVSNREKIMVLEYRSSGACSSQGEALEIQEKVLFNNSGAEAAYIISIRYLPRTFQSSARELLSLLKPTSLGLILLFLFSILIPLFLLWRFGNWVFRTATRIVEGQKDARAPRLGTFEIQELTSIWKAQQKLNNSIQSHAVKAMASQVAHDIRSPLAALDSVVGNLDQFPEEKRLIVRNSVGRIRDIANNLLQKQVLDLLSSDNSRSTVSLQFLSNLIDPLISEKRTEFRSKINVDIEWHLGVGSYGAFAEVEAMEFRRLLSSLIDDAVESLPNQKGRVRISLEASELSDIVQIQISDNGPNISLKNERIVKAQQKLALWRGQITVKSEGAAGTRVLLELPKKDPPTWFVSKIWMERKSRLVIVDDDSSIHSIWRGRFQSMNASAQTELVHLSTPEQFTDWVQTHPEGLPTLFLVDYEFLGSEKNGLDLIQDLKIAERSILVTSRFDERHILSRCEDLGVRLIPKGMASAVPIEITALVADPVDAVLIDDDPLTLASWKMAADLQHKKIRCFAEPNEFIAKQGEFSKDSPIYIDVNLGRNISGVDVAKRVFALGFRNLYLSTGYSASDFSELTFLKGVVGKSPPF